MTQKSDRSDALIVIPALNEAATIGWVLDRAASHAPQFDLLVVDDGSSDDTAARARQAGATVVSHPFNLGYGAALQTGYKWAERHGYEYLVQMDADGQHDPAIAPAMAEVLRRDEADVVIGSRFIKPSGYDMGLPRTAGRLFFHRLLRLLGGPPILDPTSGLQAFCRAAFTYCCRDFYPTDFPDADVLLLLHRRGFRIKEVPARMHPSRAAKPSMHGGLRAVYYTYKMLLSTFRNALGPPGTSARERSGPRQTPAGGNYGEEEVK